MVMVFAHDGCKKDEDSLNAITLWVVWKILEKNVEMETQRIFVIINYTLFVNLTPQSRSMKVRININKF